MLVADLYPGRGHSVPWPHELAGRLFVTASLPEHGREILTESLEPLVEALPGYASLDPVRLYEVGGKLFFIGTSAESGSELWVIEGTGALELTDEGCSCRTAGLQDSTLVVLLFLTLLSLRPRLRR